MILVDGRETGMDIKKFQNLEELLVQIMGGHDLEGRVITDVLVNHEAFSEIYPHQAEDIETAEIESVEIVTMPVKDMGMAITQELHKVVRLMDQGAARVADLFRQADDAEALEVYQDLLDVIRDFLSMIGVLRGEFSLKTFPDFNAAAEEISGLFSEMMEVMANEDWILLADLLEYEFIPAITRWKQVISGLEQHIQGAAKG